MDIPKSYLEKNLTSLESFISKGAIYSIGMIQIDDHHGGRIRLSESGVSLYRRRELTRDIEW